MKKFLLAALLGCGLLAIPAVSNAAPVSDQIQMAQLEMRVGPNGVRVDDGRGRDRRDDRRFNNDRRDDRRFNSDRRERFDDRGDFGRRRFAPPQRCRTYVVRHRTPYGMRTERVRRCG